MRKSNYMTEQNTTPFEIRCEILGDVWLDYKGNPEFEEFVSYNDLGLPLAFGISTQIVTATPKAELFINESFDMFLATIGKTDEGYDSLDDVFGLEPEE
jgi:hypothetical protein